MSKKTLCPTAPDGRTVQAVEISIPNFTFRTLHSAFGRVRSLPRLQSGGLKEGSRGSESAQTPGTQSKSEAHPGGVAETAPTISPLSAICHHPLNPQPTTLNKKDVWVA